MSRGTLPGAICCACVVALSWLLLGCQDEWAANRPQPVPVSGTVLHNGAPVDGAKVVFVPSGHTYAAAGQTDAQGRFTLRTFEPNDGAVPGEYKVTVRKVEVPPAAGDQADDAPQAELQEHWLLPGKYSEAQSSGLTATVTESGVEDLTFNLEGTPGPPSQRGAVRAGNTGE